MFKLHPFYAVTFLALLALSPLPSLAATHKIDDSDTTIDYSTGWNIGQDCSRCVVVPGDRSQIYSSSWHDITLRVAPEASFRYNFTGTGVAVYGILVDHKDVNTTNTNLTFSIDGRQMGTFFHQSLRTTKYYYNSQVFNATELADSSHTLTVELGRPSLFLFDYLTYESSDDTTVDSPGTGIDAPVGSSSKKSLGSGAIAGIAIGGIAVIAIVIIAFLLFRRRQRNREHHSNHLGVGHGPLTAADVAQSYPSQSFSPNMGITGHQAMSPPQYMSQLSPNVPGAMGVMGNVGASRGHSPQQMSQSLNGGGSGPFFGITPDTVAYSNMNSKQRILWEQQHRDNHANMSRSSNEELLQRPQAASGQQRGSAAYGIEVESPTGSGTQSTNSDSMLMAAGRVMGGIDLMTRSQSHVYVRDPSSINPSESETSDGAGGVRNTVTLQRQVSMVLSDAETAPPPYQVPETPQTRQPSQSAAVIAPAPATPREKQ